MAMDQDSAVFADLDVIDDPFAHSAIIGSQTLSATSSVLTERSASHGPIQKTIMAQADQYKAQLRELARLKALQEAYKKEQQEEQLSEMLDNSGGLADPKKAQAFVRTMLSETNVETRSLMLSIIEQTQKPLCRKALVHEKVIRVMKRWMVQSVKDGATNLVVQILKVLFRLPITLEELKATEIGKLVKKLHNHDDERVKAWSARVLVALKSAAFKALNDTDAAPEAVTTTPTKTKSPSKAPSPAAKPKPTAKALAVSSDFDNMLAASPAKPKPAAATRTLGTKNDPRRGVQLVDADITVEGPQFLQAHSAANSRVSRPLSADDIRKAKLAGKQQKSSSKDKDGQDKEKEREKEKEKVKEERITPTSATTDPETAMDVDSPPRLGREESRLAKRKRQEQIEREKTRIKQEGEGRDGEGDGERPRKKKRKRVSWAASDKLVQVRTFEKYLSSMNRQMTFQEQVEMERMHERENTEMQRRREEDDWMRRFEAMEPTVAWRQPALLELPKEMQRAQGDKSKEVAIQQQRESKVLSEQYMSVKEIPPSPAEPQNLEQDYKDSDVTIIPLDQEKQKPAAAPSNTLDIGLALSSLFASPELSKLLGQPQAAPTQAYPAQQQGYPPQQQQHNQQGYPVQQPPYQQQPPAQNYPQQPFQQTQQQQYNPAQPSSFQGQGQGQQQFNNAPYNAVQPTQHTQPQNYNGGGNGGPSHYNPQQPSNTWSEGGGGGNSYNPQQPLHNQGYPQQQQQTNHHNQGYPPHQQQGHQQFGQGYQQQAQHPSQQQQQYNPSQPTPYSGQGHQQQAQWQQQQQQAMMNRDKDFGRLCRFWTPQNPAKCRNGTNCIFKHDAEAIAIANATNPGWNRLPGIGPPPINNGPMHGNNGGGHNNFQGNNHHNNNFPGQQGGFNSPPFNNNNSNNQYNHGQQGNFNSNNAQGFNNNAPPSFYRN